MKIMLVNIFKNNNTIDDKNIISKVKNKDIDDKIIYIEIQEYLISNYLSLLQNDKVALIKEKIIEQLSIKYGILEREKQKTYLDVIISKIFGYDILQKYIDNEEVSDIRTIAWNIIYIKKLGLWERVEDEFSDKVEYEQYVRYVVLKNGGKINFEYPIVTISDKTHNLRIEAGIAPVNVSDSSLVIRIHRYSKSLTLENLFIEHDMFNSKIYNLLLSAIKNKLNIVIAGKGASGKTSLLRGMINAMDDNVAMVTNEETCELYINNKNIIQREVISNRKNDKNIDLEMLTSHSLVMSNDVIIIGEIKR